MQRGSPSAPLKDWMSEDVLALRARLGWTQRQLGDAIEVRPQTVSAWERGLAHPGGVRVLRALDRLDALTRRKGTP